MNGEMQETAGTGARPTVAARRAGAVATLAIAVALWVLALALVAEPAPGARAGGTRGLEMVIAYPTGDGWETAIISMLLEDTPDFEVIAEQVRAERLADFPGGVEVAPQVAAQFKTLGFALQGATATWWYNAEGKPASLVGDHDAFRAGAAAWTNAGGTGFAFIEGGVTTAGASVCDGGTRDSQNTIAWEDLPLTTLGETCYLVSQSKPVEFDLRFDVTKEWTTSATEVTIDLQSVATHEFGHALGLAHPDGPNSTVMNRSYRRGTLVRQLTADDIAGVVAIYGSMTPSATATFTPTPTVTPTPGGGPPVSGPWRVPALSRQ